MCPSHSPGSGKKRGEKMSVSDSMAKAIVGSIRDAITSIHWCLDGPISMLGGGSSPCRGRAAREQYTRELYENIDSYLREVTGMLDDATYVIGLMNEHASQRPYAPQPIPPTGLRKRTKNE